MDIFWAGIAGKTSYSQKKCPNQGKAMEATGHGLVEAKHAEIAAASTTTPVSINSATPCFKLTDREGKVFEINKFWSYFKKEASQLMVYGQINGADTDIPNDKIRSIVYGDTCKKGEITMQNNSKAPYSKCSAALKFSSSFGESEISVEKIKSIVPCH